MITIAATPTISPAFAAQPVKQATAISFGHAEDKADISEKKTKKVAGEGKKLYKFGMYFGLPSRNEEGKRTAQTVLKDLFLPTQTLWSDLIWAMLLPPFTFVVPAVGLIMAAVNHNKKEVNDPTAQGTVHEKSNQTIPDDDDDDVAPAIASTADNTDTKTANAAADTDQSSSDTDVSSTTSATSAEDSADTGDDDDSDD